MEFVTVTYADVINVEAHEVTKKDSCDSLSSKTVRYFLYFNTSLRWKWRQGKKMKMEICFSM